MATWQSIKSYGVLPLLSSLYIKKDGTKNSSSLQFTAQHLKSMVYVLGKINLFSSVLRACVAV